MPAETARVVAPHSSAAMMTVMGITGLIATLPQSVGDILIDPWDRRHWARERKSGSGPSTIEWSLGPPARMTSWRCCQSAGPRSIRYHIAAGGNHWSAAGLRTDV